MVEISVLSTRFALERGTGAAIGMIKKVLNIGKDQVEKQVLAVRVFGEVESPEDEYRFVAQVSILTGIRLVNRVDDPTGI